MKRYIRSATGTNRVVTKAMNTAKADARKAIKKWHDSGLEIDTILKDMGYNPIRSDMYKYYIPVTDYSAEGFSKAYAVIDYYHLVIGNGPNYMEVYVVDDPSNPTNMSDIKRVADKYIFN